LFAGTDVGEADNDIETGCCGIEPLLACACITPI